MAAAISDVQFILCSFINEYRPNDKVYNSLLLAYNNGPKKSENVYINEKIVIVAIPGFVSGKATKKNLCHALQPSIFADYKSSSGIPNINCLRIII